MQVTVPTDGSLAPTGTDPTASGRLFLSSGERVTAGGKLDIFGTSGTEYVTVTQGEVTLDPDRFAGLLNRIDGPWMDDLEKLVIKELQVKRPDQRRFGDRAAHLWLTLDQLRQVAEAIPSVAASDVMVAQVLLRLRPSDDQDMRQQQDVRAAYLERLEQFVTTLPDAYLSLKAATLYQRLQLDLATGKWDRERFLRYLRLPRSSEIVPVPVPGVRRAMADLGQDFSDLAALPRIGDERPLIRTYLEHFLKDADSTDAFEGLLKPDYLRTVFAETKLLYGVEPSERWYSMLPTSSRQSLRDRVELTLAPTNPRIHGTEESTELTLDLKHVDKLVVKLYRIHTHSYYRTRTAAIDTDVDLDGLTPTHEREIAYSFAPTRRHRETIDLPEIKGRGVWIVDLLGGGLRARAMIRRGEIQYAISSSANGMRLTAMDENRKPIPSAKLGIASQELVANEQGRIEIPPLDQQVQRTAVLHDADLAIPITFPHVAESYSLHTAMYVDRQQLQSGKLADLIVRTRLMMADKPIDPAVLQDPVITVTATDLDGIATTRRFDKLTIQQLNELSLSFRVPPRLASLSATLTGKVRRLSTNELSELSATQNWNVATVRRTAFTSTAHLTRSGSHWLIETRGRGGEVIGGEIIQVTLHPTVRPATVSATLQSNGQGIIDLGQLPGIDSLDISQGDYTFSVDLRHADAVWPSRLNKAAGEEIHLPLPGPEREVNSFRLLSMRGDGRPQTDHSTALQIGSGRLSIAPLDPGNYRLYDIERANDLLICVTAGPILGEVAAGKVRHLELTPRSELGIESVEQGDEEWRIKVAGATPLTRVHLVVNRYIDRSDAIHELQLPEVPVSTRGLWHATSGYISDLRLGEEYQYVMRRQYAAKYPGVMLPQPGLILNPWETRSTENDKQQAQTGDAPAPTAAPQAPMKDPEAAAKSQSELAEVITPDYDFLRDSGAVIFNLRLDKDGVVRIANDLVAGMPIVQVIAADPLQVVRRTIYAERDDVEFADLRLAKALDAKRALAFARGVVIASANKPLDLKSLGSAQVQLYSSVADLMKLLMTMQSDARLNDFQPIASWHTLDHDGKRSLYGRLACHELHLFLSVHDPDFFEQVVRPYLQNKLEKQFVDHYLLDEDLTPWTQMWRYHELNAAEKVLLARRVPAMADTVRREFRELLEAIPDDPELVRKLVEAGLAGSALDDSSGGVSALFGDKKLSQSWHDNQPMYAYGGMAMGMSDRFESTSSEAISGPAELRLNRRGAIERSRRALGKEPQSADFDASFFGSRMAILPAPMFQNLSATKQWAESQWDRVRVTTSGSMSPDREAAGDIQSPALIPVDRFWLAVAEAGPDGTTLNEHLLRPITSRHAVLTALAYCGLPLNAAEVKLPADDQPFAPAHPVALVTKRLIELKAAGGDGSVLVGQRFAAQDEDTSDPQKDVPAAPNEFLIHRVYRGEVIVTNPTPKRRTVDVLWQIPEGSIALEGGQATDSKTISLEAFAVQRISYSFYFPQAGNFVHYPVCVGIDGTVVARGSERTFNVVAIPSRLDEDSWPSIAAGGDATKIDAFLKTANLRKIDIGLVAHRMKERSVYDVVTRYLAAHQIDRDDLWGYAFHHRDVSGMKTYLSLQHALVGRVGPVLNSPLLIVNPIDRRMYEFLEYAPLVLARIHPLKAQHEILNPTLKDQYAKLIRVISYQPQSEAQQQLSLIHYMVVQNRIEDAIALFAKLDGADLETKLQYDYLAGYLALHRGDYATAQRLSTSYADHPVPRWRDRFRAMATNLRQRDELMQGSGLVAVGSNNPPGVLSKDADLALLDREQRNADSAAAEPFVNVKIEGATLHIDHRNTDRVTVNLYAVDLELLFSKTPFVRDDLAEMAMVEPTLRETLELEAKNGVKAFRLDDNLSRQTLLVEVVSGAARSTTLYYGGKLSAYVSQGFGQLQVSDSTTRQPVEGAYVKVYARHDDGSVSFYKDGYTDLRGRYDYVSLSTGELATAQRFAILVIDPERGATLHEAAPPTR
ncbi:MAG: hypothetical protein ACO1RT_00010 [Planctomycetaceae bacterium]